MRTVKQYIYAWIDKKFLNGCSSYNSLAVRKSCRSKLQGRKMFAEHGIPHAKGTTFFWPQKAFSFAREHGFPLVIKPNVSGFSRGSHFPITNFRELLIASLLVKIWWPVSVVEEYLLGKNYRVATVEGDIMSLIRRYPPFVDGDGVHTINELIDMENAERERMKLYPTIHPIAKDGKTLRYLKKHGKSLSTVPTDGERVYTFHRVALAPGGIIEIVDKESMHPDNRAMFLKILNLFNANILGIDVIFSEGIEKSYKGQDCILLEVNSRPYLKMHDTPRFGIKEDLSLYYARLNQLNIAEADIF